MQYYIHMHQLFTPVMKTNYYPLCPSKTAHPAAAAHGRTLAATSSSAAADSYTDWIREAGKHLIIS